MSDFISSSRARRAHLLQQLGKAVWRGGVSAESSVEDRQRSVATADQHSPFPGWQEGAFLFAEHALDTYN